MKKFLSVTFVALSILFLVGCNNTPPATEEELAQLNSEAQQTAQIDRLRNIVGYMTTGDESAEIYANDFFGIYTYFGNWDYTYYPKDWNNSDYQWKIGNASSTDSGEAIYTASYGNGYCKSSVSIRKEGDDENFQPEIHIDDTINQYNDPEYRKLMEDVAPELLDMKHSKVTIDFCLQETPALFVSDYSEEYEHQYYEKTVWVKKDGFIAEISAFCYDEDITDKILEQYFNDISLLRVWHGLPMEYSEDKDQNPDSANNDFDLWQVITDKTTLNIREEPSSDSKKVGYLKKGAVARVTKYDETGKWGFVNDLESNDTKGFARGWINLEYCTENIAMGGGWVFLIEDGSYYHIRSCKELNGYSDNLIDAWPADQAEEEGYNPCPKCGGF